MILLKGLGDFQKILALNNFKFSNDQYWVCKLSNFHQKENEKKSRESSSIIVGEISKITDSLNLTKGFWQNISQVGRSKDQYSGKGEVTEVT